ncbi:MAG: AsmA family protein [Elusimicrobia bacterium]|nr:AsmA family protein [Elusimicrobiota bacterium]
MAMRGKLKILVGIAAAFLGLSLLIAALAPFLLRKYLPPEKIRALLVGQAQKTLRRELRLGEVSWSLVKGLSARDLAVSEFPDFKAGTFAQMRSFDLKVRILPLLRRKLIVDRVRIEGLALSVVKRSDGSYNFTDLSASSAPAKPQPSAGAAAGAGVALPLSFDVNRAHISGSRFTYQDLAQGEHAEISGLEAVIKNFRLSGPFELELSFKSSGRLFKRSVRGGLSFSGSLDLGNQDPARISADIKQLTVRYLDWRAQAEGKIENLKKPKGQLAFSFLSKEAEILSGEVSGAAVLPGPEAQAAFEGDFQVKTPGFKGNALSGLVASLPPGLRVPAFKSSGRAALKGDALELSPLKLEGSAGIMDISGRISGWKAKKPDLDIHIASRLNLPELKAEDIPLLKLAPKLVMPAAKVDLQAGIKGQDLSLSRLRLETRQGSFQASGTVKKATSPKPEFDLEMAANLSIPAFNTSALPVPVAQIPPGLSVPPFSLDAQVTLKGTDARISRFNLKTGWGKMAATGVVRQALGDKPLPDLSLSVDLDLPELKAGEIPFLKLPPSFITPAAAIAGRVRLQGDTLSVDSLEAKNKAGMVAVSGVVQKAFSRRPKPNLDVTAKLSLPALRAADIPFAGLPAGLELPPSRWDGALSATLDEAKIKSLRILIGSNDVELSGKISALRAPRPSLDLLVKCRSFVLEELTKLTPKTREMELSGRGFLAIAISGKPDKPVLEGKMQFKGLGATVAGLKLSDFTGTVKFDEKRIDIPNLKGQVADGALSMDLTVKNYGKAPDIDLDASLSQFDLGKFLAAKAALKAAAEHPSGALAQETAQPHKEEGRPLINAKGRFAVAKLTHPNAECRDLRLSWDLGGISPDMSKLGGWAKMQVAGGKFNNLGMLATQSPLVKVLIFPLLIFQKIGSLGGIRLFPDFNNIDFSEIAGDYAFKEGVMTLQDSHLYSDAANVNSQGRIDLPAEKLDLTVTAQVANIAPMDIDVKGTFSSPSTKLKVGKFLAEPAKQLIENIFRK